LLLCSYMKFILKKPQNWAGLPFYMKVRYYSNCLDERYAIYVDKIEAKKIIENETNGEIRIARIIKQLPDIEPWKYLVDSDISPDVLLKPSHASGWNIDLKYNIHLNQLQQKVKSMCRPYSQSERQYRYIRPRFFLEEKVIDKYFGKTGKAIVYMVRCIHGKPVSIGVKFDNLNLLYDLQWKPMIDHPKHIEKPVKLEKMIYWSEKLSSQFEFVRIDFYIDNHDELYFSEFTFTPSNGAQTFPIEIERMFGALWT
jgi:TupA-like ATPgrasp